MVARCVLGAEVKVAVLAIGLSETSWNKIFGEVTITMHYAGGSTAT